MKKVIYYGIFLCEEDRARLKQFMQPYLQQNDGWREYIHHMTISFGEPKDPTVRKYIDDNMGKPVELQVIGYGQDNRAAAVLVTGGVSNNRIHHITMYVAPGAKPVDSNRIEDWCTLPSDAGTLVVTGIVDAVYEK